MIPVAIICGGKGTRMGDTLTKKELIPIDDHPVLWHVLRVFSAYGHNNFVLALGHLGDHVRRYFLEYDVMQRDTQITLGRNKPQVLSSAPQHPAWDISLIDTGLETEKGSRIGKLRDHLKDADRFFVAYGEALADIDLDALQKFHATHGKLATITGIQVNFQYGVINADEGGKVNGFQEKPLLPYWINGGFMLFEKAILDMIPIGRTDYNLESELLATLAEQDQLRLYRHTGYWQSMKTLKDAQTLQRDWAERQPWKLWE